MPNWRYARFGESVSYKLRVNVKAPNNLVRLSADGRMVVDPSFEKATGKWIVFKPMRQ